MRTTSPQCLAYLNAHNIAFRADLVTVTLASGATYRWSTWNEDLTVPNVNREDTQLFRAHSETDPTAAPIVIIGAENEGGEGLSVASQDITLAGLDFLVDGKTLPVLAADGGFDDALVTLDHLFMPAPGDVSLQSFIDFQGTVAAPDIGVDEVTLRCKSWLAKAAQRMLPNRTFTANCSWEHMGAECGLDRLAYATTGTVTAVLSESVFNATTFAHNGETYSAGLRLSTGFAPHLYMETRGWWDLGVITFVGNVTPDLAGKSCDILQSDSAGLITLSAPAPAMPAVGDAFSILPGCNRDAPSCTRYDNFVHFGGTPLVPPNSSTPVK